MMMMQWKILKTVDMKSLCLWIWPDCDFPVYSLLPCISRHRCHWIRRHFYLLPVTKNRRIRKRWHPLFSHSLSRSLSISLFKLPKDGPPLVDRLTYYKSTKRLNHHLKAPCSFLTSFQSHLERYLLPLSPFECLSLCCLTSWNYLYRSIAFEGKKNKSNSFLSVYSVHLFCAVTMYDTRVEALPIMYGQRRTDLPSSTDLQSVLILWGGDIFLNCT